MPREKPDDLLFILGADHRIDLLGRLLGVEEGEPTAAQLERAAHLKGIVFAGLASAVEAGLPKSDAGIWADMNIGEAVLLRARGMSLSTVASVERPGVREFQFEDVPNFAERLKVLDASYAGVRLRYNPADDEASNEPHRHKLRRLSEICRSSGPGLVIELIVPTNREQIESAGSYSAWETDVRPAAMVQAMRELQDSGVEPDLWVVDPPLDSMAAATVAAQAHVDDRARTGVLFVVGVDPSMAAADPGHEEIVRLAARTPGVTGLLLGPATYFEHLARYHRGDMGREGAVEAIAASVQHLRSHFTDARRTSQVS